MLSALYTIGHSNHAPDDFVGLLQAHRIEAVADVRSQPYSRYCPHFNRRSLAKLLTDNGMDYLFLGQHLGGRPSAAGFYDEAGKVLYHRLAESESFQQGVRRLLTEMDHRRVAIMCGEENPAHCHRFLLVSRVLARGGIEICHIRRDGSITRDADLRAAGDADRQGLLFEEMAAEAWKSARSVGPRNLPPQS